MTKGNYVVIEGLDGTGKGTITEKLVAELRARGIDVVTTHEPGGSPFAEDIRTALKRPRDYDVDAITEALAFSAARRDNWLQNVKPALDAGKWVVTDRSFFTMLAYQGYGRRQLPEVETLFDLTYGPGFKFDTCIVLDLPVDEAFENMKRRDGELCRIEGLDRQVFEDARWAYMNRDLILKYSNHYLPIPMADVFKNDLSSAVAKDLAEFLIRDYENERPSANSNAG